MQKAIPIGLTTDHVLLALADLDSGIEHPFGSPTGYELDHDGKRYPPKAVVGLAFNHLRGTILGPDEFSGGEAPGQANYVLRKLGFNVVEKRPLAVPQSAQAGEFITSRGFALPTSEQEMSQNLWFNMWQRRLWPYQELQFGSTLYWYDTDVQTIVWKSRVSKVVKFEYEDKQSVRQRFREVFGIADLADRYFDAAADHGYCVAFKVDNVQRLRVPKPDEYRFPQGGWLRCNDPAAKAWLFQILDVDGPSSTELITTVANMNEDGYFFPATLQDERERRIREIVARRGQPEFRNILIAAYDGRCAVTGCDALAASEAAHVVPYCGSQSNHVSNGLLLRADIHTLFDLDLIGIDPETVSASVGLTLAETDYGNLQGRRLRLPVDPAARPNPQALAE
jgi:hypothetical protein